MSIRPTKVTDEIYDYMDEHFSSENDFLKNINLAAKVKGMPEIQISGMQARFLQFMLKSINAKYVLEIGALGGYSAVSMAMALPEGSKLITVEKNPDWADFVRKNVHEAGLDHIVEVVTADGRDFLKNFKPDYELDFVFVDADKPGYYHYLQSATPLIRKGGIFAADNAFAFGFLLSTAPERDPEDIKSVKSFNNAFAAHKDYLVTLVPVGDGIIMGTKI